MTPKCRGKKRHRNQTGAIIALKKLKNAGLAAYPCSICKGWHIGNSTYKKLDRLNQLFERIKQDDSGR